MGNKFLALIHATLQEARRQRVTIGAVRLVKLLYLVEVEFYKQYGRRLTDANWRYHLYGPYPDEFKAIEGEGVIVTEDIPIPGDRILRKFAIDEDAKDVGSTLSWEEARLVPFVVKEWGDASLNSLLNHVYFHTAPMKGARQRGDQLDFSTIRPEASKPVLSPALRGTSPIDVLASASLPVQEAVDVKKVQGLFRKFVGWERSKPRRKLISPRIDRTYIAALERLASPERTLSRGEVEITAESYPFLRDQK